MVFIISTIKIGMLCIPVLKSTLTFYLPLVNWLLLQTLQDFSFQQIQLILLDTLSPRVFMIGSATRYIAAYYAKFCSSPDNDSSPNPHKYYHALEPPDHRSHKRQLTWPIHLMHLHFHNKLELLASLTMFFWPKK